MVDSANRLGYTWVPPLLALVDVQYEGAASERYFLPLALCSAAGTEPLGRLEVQGASVSVRDALLDAGCCRALLRAIERSCRKRSR